MNVITAALFIFSFKVPKDILMFSIQYGST